MITLLIPTINRSDFIIKYLNFLRENHFDGQVLLGDSSGKEHFELTNKYIDKFDSNIEIKQYSFPNTLPHICIQKMLKDIRYPYCMNINDDDLLIMKTLIKCVDFLDTNPDYSGVGGLAVRCDFNTGDYNKINSIGKYEVSEVLNDKAVERVYGLMNNYNIASFSLARTEQFKDRWPTDDRNQNKGIGVEYLPAAVLVAQGKVKMLENLFLVRQIHDRRILLPSFFDTFLMPDWASSTTFAIEYVAELAAEIDSISFDKVYPIVKKAWENYHTRVVRKKTQNQFPGKSSIWQIPDFRSIAKSIPGSREIVRRIRSLRVKVSASQGEISLLTLLNPASPYHEDFMTAYDNITNKPKEQSSTGFARG